MTERRVVAVLGAGGALGSAISARLASEPATDLVLSDLSADALRATVDAISARRSTVAGAPADAADAGDATGAGPADAARGAGAVGGGVETLTADVGDFEQVEAVVARAVSRFGRLDVVVSNAGVLSPNGRIHNLDTADWERAFRVNVMGSVNAVKAAVGVMRPQGGGSIVLTASVSGMTAWSHAAPYCVTKAGVIHLAKVAAVEYARDHIRVNCVCPGSFRSAIHADLPDQAIDAIAAKHPLGLGEADDLVGAYSYLASDASRWTTGAALVVDGGYSAP